MNLGAIENGLFEICVWTDQIVASFFLGALWL